MITKMTREVKTSKKAFIQQYSEQVEKVDTMRADTQELAELQAKHPADVFVVAEFEEGQTIPEIAQGDVLLWRKGCRQYDKYVDSISNLKETKSRNLQLGDSVTGDHKVVPLKNSNLKIEDCTIRLERSGRDLSYPAKIITADAPFCVVHREHGNVTLPEGTYMSCVSLNPKTMTRMLD